MYTVWEQNGENLHFLEETFGTRPSQTHAEISCSAWLSVTPLQQLHAGVGKKRDSLMLECLHATTAAQMLATD